MQAWIFDFPDRLALPRAALFSHTASSWKQTTCGTSNDDAGWNDLI